MSPRTLAVSKCIDEQHIQRPSVVKSRRLLATIEKLAAMRGHFYYVEALVKEMLMADLDKE